MSKKKVMGITAIVILGGLGIFICMLFFTIKTKTKNLHNYEPFKEWVGKTVELNRETVLFTDHGRSDDNSTYPYVLLDSLHPHWPDVVQHRKVPRADLAEIRSFPAGTKLKIEEAIQYTNGVSGFSYPTVFGTVSTGNETYKIAYLWGTLSMSRYFDKVEQCWQFHQAPWQNKQDTAFYAVPKAKIW